MLQHKMNSSSYAKVHNVSSLEDIMSYHNDDVLLKFRKEWNVHQKKLMISLMKQRNSSG